MPSSGRLSPCKPEHVAMARFLCRKTTPYQHKLRFKNSEWSVTFRDTGCSLWVSKIKFLATAARRNADHEQRYSRYWLRCREWAWWARSNLLCRRPRLENKIHSWWLRQVRAGYWHARSWSSCTLIPTDCPHSAKSLADSEGILSNMTIDLKHEFRDASFRRAETWSEVEKTTVAWAWLVLKSVVEILVDKRGADITCILDKIRMFRLERRISYRLHLHQGYRTN